MKAIIPAKTLVLTTILCALGAFDVSTRAADTAKVSWKIDGELEEACSCRPACPCWFKSLPSRMTCDGVQIVFIRKGHYGKVPLDGLMMSQFTQSPEHQSMFESFGNYTFDYIYIDDKATGPQRAALKELSLHFFPAGAKSREYRFVPISRQINGDEHATSIGTNGFCSGHLIAGGFEGAPKIVNPPLADPTHKQYLQGETTKLMYTDAGQDWKYENSNYMRNQFVVDNKQYEKYEAAQAAPTGK